MATVNMDRLLQACVSQGASDIHISVGRPPVLRIDGHLRSLETKVLEPDDTVALMKSITPERCEQEIQEEGGTDFGFAFGDAARFRVSVFKQKGNISIVLRQIPNKLLTFEQLGLPKICAALCRRPRGLFLVTGPTGSGKTTTLATMINYINENFDRHIVTVEDPIEYYQPHKKSIINQREVGVDVPSFAEALRRVLRQDPDVILVGELRDLETIEAAVRAAETGHLVFSTVHTTSAAGTINRIIDVFPVDQQEQIRIQLAGNLLAVLSQALCPLASGRGRIAAYEFLVVTPAIANLIRENKTYRIDSSIQTGKKLGMQLLDEHLWNLYDSGKITLEEMLDKGRGPGALQEKALAKIASARGKMKKKAAEAAQELEDMGPILKT
ncbi:MAG: type IV pilus twitching motility protein PilT [Sedimentisphaerales bacterium]|jgi:twitching motility protein PilT|nr:type IV pilus twitching motility protein PilT [Sedimentisphaerales bacterium]NLZ04998.1 type IV pilus twitching motility protein PilT [Phycisphaerae bacterium]HNY77931.1 type IV pilus twitching motility protein PilT [Sedimentisphaerales bacterium]HOC63327.1 type IV pilus twitching motility protein PilT [Sedimentisphaerales bacterium]HOH64143.1 type IV pilus twitching motility protein PilT [Sedimentisphaerales bacterium]